MIYYSWRYGLTWEHELSAGLISKQEMSPTYSPEFINADASIDDIRNGFILRLSNNQCVVHIFFAWLSHRLQMI